MTQTFGQAEAQLWREAGTTPLEPTQPVTAAGVQDFDHLYLGTCTLVHVTIRYADETRENDFPPATPVQAVYEWAAGPNGFKLTGPERAKHTLGVCGSATEAERTEHLAALATDCQVCFTLAPKTRYQG